MVLKGLDFELDEGCIGTELGNFALSVASIGQLVRSLDFGAMTTVPDKSPLFPLIFFTTLLCKQDAILRLIGMRSPFFIVFIKPSSMIRSLL